MDVRHALVAVGHWLASLWHWLTSQDAAWWSAAAGWATVAVAVLASIFAFHQVREARRTREDQAQPYVVAYLEANTAVPFAADLVVKNFGTTAAFDVRLSMTPKPQRTKGPEIVDLAIFDKLPVLVPGQEWRTIWDAFSSRNDSGLPRRYGVVVSYSDSRKQSLEIISELDWAPFGQVVFTRELTVHHVAKALQEIEKSISKWNEDRDGLAVYVRDGHAKDERKRQKLEEWDAMLAAQDVEDDDGEDSGGQPSADGADA
ncbi:hypothetical protein [Hamadaea tsunoensis]|uniref:hypothetical protein n=1 Tax=Hamadaea tsunoensis TaxID=53368 RepID=UPI000489A949|nr:hypothetical protein [Hamadaea tsunoensis]